MNSGKRGITSRMAKLGDKRATSLLKKPADKEDCAAMAVTMCRTDTMTGQTIAIDSGRYFH